MDASEFYSNAKTLYPLSNFHLAPFTTSSRDVPDEVHVIFPLLREWLTEAGKKFNSSEHLWQSLKATNYKTFLKFTHDGIFGSEDVLAFFNLLDPKTAQSKVDYWMKKQNIGIVPKMAVNATYRKKLGLDVGDIDSKKEYLGAADDPQPRWPYDQKKEFVRH